MYDFDPFLLARQPLHDWSQVDRFYQLPSNDQIKHFARIIDQHHADQRDQTKSWRSEQNRIIGLMGERCFARVFGIRMDMRLLKFGNRRKNFTLNSGRIVDVVTRTWKNPIHSPELTIRHKGNPSSNLTLALIYWFDERTEPVIVGWITEKDAHSVGRIDRFKDGIENVVVPHGLLRDPVQLLREHNPESPWVYRHIENQAVQDIPETPVKQEVVAYQRSLWEEPM